MFLIWFALDDIKLFGTSQQHLDSLLTTLSLFSEDICMKFGYSNCNILTLSKGCAITFHGFKLPSVSDEIITNLKPTSAYCYLGILETGVFHHKDMMGKLSADYR